MDKKIKEAMKEYFGTSDYLPPVKWNGYSVYEPKYSEPTFNFGLSNPFLLVRGDEIRVSTADEEQAFRGYVEEDDDPDAMQPTKTLTGLGEN